MLQEFTVNARQYYDFTKLNEDSENVDTFFDQISETRLVRRSLKEEMKLVDDNDDDDGDNSVFFSPMKTDTDAATVVYNSNLRRSLSVGNLNLSDENQNEPQMRLQLNKLKSIKCGSTNSLNTLHQERINKLAQPKETGVKSNNFVSMAEAVMKFHKDTPKRFRSVEDNSEQSNEINLKITRPHTPKLLTKNRIRPIYVLSKEEQENLEMEEAKKFKIKAHRVNSRILQPPTKAVLLKKPPTIPEPFKLSQMMKKEVAQEESSDKVNFRAKPVPKTVYQPFEIKHATTALTIPSTPQCLKKYVPKTGRIAATPPPPQRKEESQLRRTKPVPFSFEKRDEDLKKKKEGLIKKTLEEEKKAREFHAKPLPKCLKHSNSSDSLQSKLSNKNNQEELHQQGTFKARPANVLKMKPFEPVKVPHMISIEEFHLSVEDRLKERHEFDLKIQETEKRLLEVKLKEEQKRIELEEQQRIKLRKQAEIKAQPIRKYKPMEIKPSNQVTEPTSPNFHYEHRKEQKRFELEHQHRTELGKQTEIKAQQIRKSTEIKPSNQVTEPTSANVHYKQRNKENVQCN